MQYSVIINNNSYELPKFTKAIKDEINKVNERNVSERVNDTDKYKGMYNFIRKCIGGEAAKEVFETENLDEMDLNEITICYLEICKAYDKPVVDANRSKHEISDSDKELVIELIKNAGNIGNLEKMLNKRAAGSALRSL